jgi:hypothetical protein
MALKYYFLGQVWWLTLIIPATRDLEDCRSQPSLGKKLVRPHLNKQTGSGGTYGYVGGVGRRITA